MADRNLARIIEQHDADRVALIDGGDVITYGELRSRVSSLRAHLSSAGVGVESRVAVLSGNEPDFVVAILAALGLGALAVPVRPNSPLPELLRKLEPVEPEVILAGESGSWVLEHESELASPLVDLAAVVDDPATAPAIVDRDGDDLAFLMLTSGVSSESKVAMLSHENLAWVQEAMSTNPEIGP